jgi:predicted metal-dependent hydrolase
MNTAQAKESSCLLQSIASSILPAAFPLFRKGEIEAAFYPYIGLTHTIRRKGKTWVVRISDHCRYAPEPVLEAILMILACKVVRKKPQPKYRREYELYRKDSELTEAVRQRRLLKGKKQIAKETGKHHPLREIYREINQSYFNNQVDIEKVGWGMRKSRTRLGHYDPVHHSITISPILDSPDVPRYVLGYVLYHEMLHTVFGTGSSRLVRTHHSPEFRRAETAYPDFAEAKRFLGNFLHKRSRFPKG